MILGGLLNLDLIRLRPPQWVQRRRRTGGLGRQGTPDGWLACRKPYVVNVVQVLMAGPHPVIGTGTVLVGPLRTPVIDHQPKLSVSELHPAHGRVPTPMIRHNQFLPRAGKLVWVPRSATQMRGGASPKV